MPGPNGKGRNGKAMDSRSSAGSGQALRGNGGSAETGAGVGPIQEPPLRQALENRLRHRVFRLRRPSLWDRVKYGLDDNGNPPPPRTELEKLEAIEG